MVLVIHRLPSSHKQGDLLISPRCKGQELIKCWIVREAGRKALHIVKSCLVELQIKVVFSCTCKNCKVNCNRDTQCKRQRPIHHAVKYDSNPPQSLVELIDEIWRQGMFQSESTNLRDRSRSCTAYIWNFWYVNRVHPINVIWSRSSTRICLLWAVGSL